MVHRDVIYNGDSVRVNTSADSSSIQCILTTTLAHPKECLSHLLYLCSHHRAQNALVLRNGPGDLLFTDPRFLQLVALRTKMQSGKSGRNGKKELALKSALMLYLRAACVESITHPVCCASLPAGGRILTASCHVASGQTQASFIDLLQMYLCLQP